ncbi:MAG: HesA/MoeB/ThiF family protein [Myxococcota bacterium]
MITEIVFPSPLIAELKQALLASEYERGAVLLTTPGPRYAESVRAIVREVVLPEPDEVLSASAYGLCLAPGLVSRVAKHARSQKMGLGFIHTHPGDPAPRFSAVDNEGERHLRAFLARRQLLDLPPVALVLSQHGVAARELGTPRPLSVREVGSTLRMLASPKSPELAETTLFDRQIRAFGPAGQAMLQDLFVGVVGLGGTGSIVVEQLARLGVRRFLLVDPDMVEESNLNRLAGAGVSDVGRPKVEVAQRAARSIRPDAAIHASVDTVIRKSVARGLAATDVIFSCTDTHGSRAVLNQLAYQYLVPVIDMGIVIAGSVGRVDRIMGRVQMLAPGLGCLTCERLLDPEAVRRDMATPLERLGDPYFLGEAAPQPAVMSLNSTVASLAVTMMLSAVVGVPVAARMQLYDAVKGTVRAVTGARDPECIVCSARGALARGDLWSLAARSD